MVAHDFILAPLIQNDKRRFWQSDMNLISVANMASKQKAKSSSRRVAGKPKEDQRKSKPTQADIEAAARLRAIRDALPKDQCPTQEQIAGLFDREDGLSQSAISQMINGVIAMPFEAVLVFARAYRCDPRDIRKDFPLFRHLENIGWGPSSSPRQEQAGYRWPFQKALFLRLDRLTDAQKNFVEQGVESAISLCEASGSAPDEKSSGRSV